ncbi:transmembrane protein 17-like [Diadema antillarum]|uniref:transmembrane protein 17-like n=1 Tax=Diadema antillarum TaxID=105358 RepID=UPI003A8B7ECA
MAANYMRQKLTSFTEVVFPTRNTERRQHHVLKPGNEMVSSLPLQVSLYFNVMFFPIWVVTCMVMLQLKFSHLNQIYQFVTITMYVVLTGVEVIRLYLGYLGNLQERVPELAGFWLLTLVLQFPLLLFLTVDSHSMPFPIERAVHMVFLLFLAFDVLAGYLALQRMTQHQVMKFHLQQFDDIEMLEETQGRFTAASATATQRYTPLR